MTEAVTERDDVALAELLAATSLPRPSDGSWVAVNMVVSVDGRSAAGGRVGALSSLADKALFGHLRTEADVVLVGAGTVRAERYGSVRVGEGAAARRRARGQAPVPPLAVVTRSGAVPAHLFDLDPAPIVCTSEHGARELAATGRAVDTVVTGTSEVDLPATLARLASRGLRTVLCEGGEQLNASLLAADLVDEWFVTLAPVLGGDDVGLAGRHDGLVGLTLRSVARLGDDVFLRYARRR